MFAIAKIPNKFCRWIENMNALLGVAVEDRLVTDLLDDDIRPAFGFG